MSFKNKLIVIISIFVVLLGGFFIYSQKKDQIVSKEFSGQVRNIEGNSIFADGVFKAADHPELNLPEYRKEVIVSVTDATKIIRTVVYFPTPEEVAATQGRYNYQDLRRETTEANLSTMVEDFQNFKESTIVKVTSRKNIFLKPNIAADHIEYTISKRPDQP